MSSRVSVGRATPTLRRQTSSSSLKSSSSFTPRNETPRTRPGRSVSPTRAHPLIGSLRKQISNVRQLCQGMAPSGGSVRVRPPSELGSARVLPPSEPSGSPSAPVPVFRPPSESMQTSGARPDTAGLPVRYGVESVADVFTKDSEERPSAPLKLSDSVLTDWEESKRHFVCHYMDANPILLGQLPADEIRRSKGIPYNKELLKEEVQKVDNAEWRRLGLFKPDDIPARPHRTPSASPTSPRLREAPHLRSEGFVSAQQPLTRRELLVMANSPRRCLPEQESLGVTSYFNNELMPPPRSVRRAEDSRGLLSEGFVADATALTTDDPSQDVPATFLSSPWAVEVSGDGSMTDRATFVGLPEKASPQKATKNTSGGSLEDGFVKSSVSATESWDTALGFISKGRQGLQRVASVPCWSHDGSSPRVGSARAQITDGLPAYNSQDSVKSLFKDCIKSVLDKPGSAPEALRTPRGSVKAPYATLEDYTKKAPAISRQQSLPPNIGGLRVSSLMSSESIKSITGPGQIQDRSPGAARDARALTDRSNADSSKAIEAHKKQLGIVVTPPTPAVCDEPITHRDPTNKRPVHRRQTIGGVPSSKASENRMPTPRRMCLSRTPQRDRAAVAAWCGELRCEVSDKPWVSLSLEKSSSKSSLTDKATGNAAVGQEIWGSKTSKELLEVHDFMRRGCAQRINAFREELNMMSYRNAMIRQHIQAFRTEADDSTAVPALMDGKASVSSSFPSYAYRQRDREQKSGGSKAAESERNDQASERMWQDRLEVGGMMECGGMMVDCAATTTASSLPVSDSEMRRLETSWPTTSAVTTADNLDVTVLEDRLLGSSALPVSDICEDAGMPHRACLQLARDEQDPLMWEREVTYLPDYGIPDPSDDFEATLLLGDRGIVRAVSPDDDYAVPAG